MYNSNGYSTFHTRSLFKAKKLKQNKNGPRPWPVWSIMSTDWSKTMVDYKTQYTNPLKSQHDIIVLSRPGACVRRPLRFCCSNRHPTPPIWALPTYICLGGQGFGECCRSFGHGSARVEAPHIARTIKQNKWPTIDVDQIVEKASAVFKTDLKKKQFSWRFASRFFPRACDERNQPTQAQFVETKSSLRRISIDRIISTGQPLLQQTERAFWSMPWGFYRFRLVRQVKRNEFQSF